MGAIEIKPVRGFGDRRQFLNLPWRLYERDPLWIPPLRGNLKELLNFKPHPFYERNEIQTFLATRDGKTVGRIGAILNRGHLERHADGVGFFGFFECENDAEAARGLFDAAKNWLREKGCTSVRGPVNPSLNYECALLVDGFDNSPYFMMTYNPPYYAELIEASGFVKSQDLYAFWGHRDMLAKLDKKLGFIVEESQKRLGVEIRTMDAKNFKSEVLTFLDIYNKSMVGSWGFVPMSPKEVEHSAAGLKHLIVPELATMALFEGKPIGVCFCLLDYNPRIKQIGGKLFPFGVFKLLGNRRQVGNVRLIAANVVPEYQRWGVALLLLGAIVPHGLDWPLQEVEFSWVMESNQSSRGPLERGGAKLYKTYRIYDAPVR